MTEIQDRVKVTRKQASEDVQQAGPEASIQQQIPIPDEDVDPREVPAEADSDIEPTPAAPQPALLRRHEQTAVYLFHPPEGAWRLNVDGWVLPCDPTGMALDRSPLMENTLGSAGLGYLSGPLQREIKNAWQGQGRPQNPVVGVLPGKTPGGPITGPLVISAESEAETAVSALFAATPFHTPQDPSTPPHPGVSAANKAVTAVLRLAAQNNVRRLAIPVLIDDPSYTEGTVMAAAMLRIIMRLLPELTPGALEAIIITTQQAEIAAALQELVVEKPSPIPSNDLPAGQDLLNVAVEAHALAEMLLLRNVEPPLCVGILGGWGSGKSFFMHLMKGKMNEIRSRSLTGKEAWRKEEMGNTAADLSEFVGHVYQIEFNAWTYAKSDLWASLMQTIFWELNRQLTLEKRLEELDPEKFSPLRGGNVWRALNQMPGGAQEALLLSELGQETLNRLRQEETAKLTADTLWSTLEAVRRDEREALRQTETEIQQVATDLAQRMAEIERQANDEIEREAKAAVWVPLKRRLAQLWQIAEEQAQAQIDQMIQAPAGTENKLAQDAERVSFVVNFLEPDTADTIRWLLANRRQRGLLIVFLLLLLLPVAAPLLLTAFTQLAFLRDLAIFSILPYAISIGGVGGHLLTQGRKWQQQINTLRKMYQAEIEKRIEELEASRETRIHREIERDTQALEQALAQPGSRDESEVEQLANQKNVAALQRRKAYLEAQAARQRQRIGLTADYVSVAEFVNSRLQSETYRPQLGLMQQVQTDLDELTDGLTIHRQDPYAAEKQAVFKRGPARIVLFIDDLDRCPPRRVVEVFEAAQLLLKTRLFVVVLALDVRYVSRALEKVYAGILSRQGEPSGLDYIEKIIQIPYRIRPVDEDALAGFLDVQMDRRIEAAVASPGAAEDSQSPRQPASRPLAQPAPAETPATSVSRVIEFSDQESAILNLCCHQVDLTPRAIKRLVNVIKLMKLVWNRSYQGTQPVEITGAAALLLTLSARYPSLMRGAFEYLWRAFRQDQNTSIGALLQNCPAPLEAAHLQQQHAAWQETVLAFEQAEVLPAMLDFRLGQATLRTLGRDAFNLVRSFSFVGDVGYDVSDNAVD